MRFAATCHYVDDVPAALDFYRRAFGLVPRLYDEAFEFAELETGRTTLAVASHRCAESIMGGGYVRPENGQAAGVEIAFVTPDVPAAFARAVEAGAAVIAEPKVVPWGQTVAYLRGVGGILIGLVTPMVLEILEERFGAPPAELTAAVLACKDFARHRQWLDLAARAASLEQFRRDAGL
jgi:predicted enzyme related to lactoylglutathione lyase